MNMKDSKCCLAAMGAELLRSGIDRKQLPNKSQMSKCGKSAARLTLLPNCFVCNHPHQLAYRVGIRGLCKAGLHSERDQASTYISFFHCSTQRQSSCTRHEDS